MNRQPMQPLSLDATGTMRFQKNELVVYLLDNGGLGLNDIAACNCNCPVADREQFAQLIGYSLDGFAELSYVRDDTYDTAKRMADNGEDEKDARIHALEAVLDVVRRQLKKLVPAVFKIHPDDLHD